MRPAPENTPGVPIAPVVDEGAPPAPQDQQLRPASASQAVVEQCKGILMAVHRLGPEAAREMLDHVSQKRDCAVRDLAVATVELVAGAAPTNPVAAAVALRFLMGHIAYTRPVLDGQVHPSVRGALRMHHAADEEVERLLRAADARDQAAEQRDHAADDRDHEAHAGPHAASEHLFDEVAREQAAIDRAWAASDRDLSAGDRADLVERLRRQAPHDPEDSG